MAVQGQLDPGCHFTIVVDGGQGVVPLESVDFESILGAIDGGFVVPLGILESHDLIDDG